MAKRLLAQYLELANSPYNDRKREIMDSIPRELSAWDNGQPVRVRELLQSRGIESTTLVLQELSGTVIDGAEFQKCWRDVVPIVQMKDNRYDYLTGETGTYAPEVAEGAEIPINTQDYTLKTITAKKYAERPLITRELVDDSKFDIISLEVEKTGARVENALNQQALNTFLDGSGGEVDRAASNVGEQAVADVRAAVEAANFIPDKIVMHPTAWGYVLKDYNPTSSYYPVGNSTTTGLIPEVFGMKVYKTSVANVSGGTYTWGYGVDGRMGMLCMDSKNAGLIGIRQDIRVEDYKDPIRDLLGFSVSIRMGAQVSHATALQRVEY